jgi:hypothetical protein
VARMGGDEFTVGSIASIDFFEAGAFQHQGGICH